MLIFVSYEAYGNIFFEVLWPMATCYFEKKKFFFSKYGNQFCPFACMSVCLSVCLLRCGSSRILVAILKIFRLNLVDSCASMSSHDH